jgi:hypothetical protein
MGAFKQKKRLKRELEIICTDQSNKDEPNEN